MNTGLDDSDPIAPFEDRGAFGHLRLPSNHVAAEVSNALHARAEALVSKAYVKLGAGKPHLAQELAARAAALDYDEHQQCRPGYWAAHMMLFNAVTDALEEAAEDEPSWLYAALEVLGAGDSLSLSVGARAMRDVLADVADDYEVTAAEKTVIRSRIGTGWDRTPWRPRPGAIL